MTRGFFMVSDGVSISEYGSGDQASQCVKEASEKLWTKLNSDQGLDDLRGDQWIEFNDGCHRRVQPIVLADNQ